MKTVREYMSFFLSSRKFTRICNINFPYDFKDTESYEILNYTSQKIKEEIPENVDLFFINSESVNEDNKIFFYLRNSNKVQNSFLFFPTYRKKMKKNWERYVQKNLISHVIELDTHNVGRFIELKIPKCDISSKIAVCSLSIGEEYKKIVTDGIKSKKMYCIQHGYDFRDDEDIIDEKRSLTWSKVLLVLKCLREKREENKEEKNKYDYVLWIDADTFIMNRNKTLDDIINTHIQGFDIGITYEYTFWSRKDFNAGVIFFRNCEWVISFLEKIYSLPGFDVRFYDQSAIFHAYTENILNSQEHVKIIYNPNIFNTFWFQYTPEDFILHLAGCKPFDLEISMKNCCPFRKTEESEKDYEDRIKYIRNMKNNFEKNKDVYTKKYNL